MKVNWNEPKFGEEEIALVTEVLRSGYVTEGPKSKELEDRIKDFLGVKHVILTTNGTAALFLAIKADEIIRNLRDYEVLVPDMTFIATATSVGWAGGKPVLVDVEKENSCIDLEKAEMKITPKTKMIIAVPLFGRSYDTNKLEKISRDHDLTIIEDVAGSLGSKNSGKYLGTFGKMGCFSLQANKIISSGHGGFVVTDDDQYYEVMRRIKDFGRMGKEEFHKIEGYNLKYNDILAAVALGQFSKLKERMNTFREQRERYIKNLTGISNISFPPLQSEGVPVYIDLISEKRDELYTYLDSQGIGTRKGYSALHQNPPYQDQGKDEEFPISSFLSKKCLLLPSGNNLSFEEIDFVSNKIKEFYK
jgi:perosamine synthetase